MKDIIVFIPSDIDAPLRCKITDFSLRNNIKITYNMDEANVIITKADIEKTLNDIFNQLKPEVCELKLAYPMELPVIQKVATKHFVQKNINIKRFNKIKQYNQIRIMNKTKHK